MFVAILQQSRHSPHFDRRGAMCTVQFPYGSCQLPRRLREPRCGHAALRRSSFEKRRLYYSIAPRRDNPLATAPHTLARKCLAWLWTSALYCVPLMAALGQSRHELRPTSSLNPAPPNLPPLCKSAAHPCSQIQRLPPLIDFANPSPIGLPTSPTRAPPSVKQTLPRRDGTFYRFDRCIVDRQSRTGSWPIREASDDC